MICHEARLRSWLRRRALQNGPVIIGEIGDAERVIVFNGDATARLEELSRDIDGGFIRHARARRDLGRLPIRERADGIATVGLAVATAT